MRNTASLKYDFDTASWIATYDQNHDQQGSGTSPDEAVDNLRYQLNKHELWVS